MERKVIIMIGVALAVIVVSAIAGSMWFASTGTENVSVDDTVAPSDSVTETQAPTSGGVFTNLQVLQSDGYKALNIQPIQSGQLPIQPPTNIGKANPFL